MAEQQVIVLGHNYHVSCIYITGSTSNASTAAELAASCTEQKYANIGDQYLFASIAVKTLGPLEHVRLPTLCHLYLRQSKGRSFLLQRVSVLVQCYNAVLLHDTLPAHDCMD